MEKETLENLKTAGNIAAQALNFGASLIKPGAKLLDVTEKIEKKILELGGELAFPVNISMNEVAAHYCAKPNDTFTFKDELVKLDVGVHVEGMIGDNALTIDLSGKHEALVKASREALNNAIKIIKPGVKVTEIGKVVEDTITKYGFQPIRNLGGHEITEWELHGGLMIPNFDSGDQQELHEGMILAIEPFATNGAGLVKDKGQAEIFSMVDYKPMRIDFARKILRHMENNQGILPWSKRAMISAGFSEAQVNYFISMCERTNMIRGYSPLAEVQDGLVSQAEHTILVTKDSALILTER